MNLSLLSMKRAVRRKIQGAQKEGEKRSQPQRLVTNMRIDQAHDQSEVMRLRNLANRKQELLDKRKETIDKREGTIAWQKEILDKRSETITKQQELINKKNELLATNQKTVRELLDSKNKHRHAMRILDLCHSAHEKSDELAAEAYVAHGYESICLAESVSAEWQGRLYCDVIEIPSITGRILPSTLHPASANFLENSYQQSMQACDGFVTIGWALENEIRKYEKETVVIPNYRNPESTHPNNQLREMCGISAQERLIVVISTITSGFREVLEAMSNVSPDIHLAAIVQLKPASYEEEMRELISSLNLEGRVHFLDFIPYEQLTSTLSSADLGLIVRDPTVPNNRISLPNRVFDYLASGIPICSPNIEDISKIVQENHAGVILDSLSAESWKKGILDALDNCDELKRNAKTASDSMIWSQLEEQLYQGFGCPKTVTFFCSGNILVNNRTLRMATTLSDFGVKVTICCPDRKASSLVDDRINVVHI